MMAEEKRGKQDIGALTKLRHVPALFFKKTHFNSDIRGAF
jgi:hypothetical protein